MSYRITKPEQYTRTQEYATAKECERGLTRLNEQAKQLADEIEFALNDLEKNIKALQDMMDSDDAETNEDIEWNDIKPSTGIPKTDLESSVQTSLGKADTALQSHQSLSAYATTSAMNTALAGKYTKPSTGIPKTDLESSVQTSLGKADTALQSHQDISGKQNISTLETAVAALGFTKNTGTYVKPSTGIPKTDLASNVQTSLGKADTALQSHQDLSAYATTAAMNTALAGKSNTGHTHTGANITNMADFVTSQGEVDALNSDGDTVGKWKYRIWSSGRQEGWFNGAFSSVNLATSSGGGYRGQVSKAIVYPSQMDNNSYKLQFIDIHSTSTDANYIHATCKPATTNTGIIYGLSPVKVSSIAVRLHIYVVNQ